MNAVEPLPLETHPERVRLRFEQDDGTVKEARVPIGTTVFDAASWNGVAIDSTCGGHGTCKKCKVRIESGEVAPTAIDFRAFSPDEIRAGWRLACRAAAQEDLVVDVPRDLATVLGATNEGRTRQTCRDLDLAARLAVLT